MGLAENLKNVEEKIIQACGRSKRERASVRLMAVTKTHPPEVIQEAAKLGLQLFGESKVQEAKAKIPLCPSNLRWHMIGHLQSNKVRDAVHFFEMIQSVDSLDLAREISRKAEAAARTMPVLLEVNTHGEASKFGYKPDTLLRELSEINRLPRLEVHGLMTIPAWGPNPEKSRPIFQQLRSLKSRCEEILGAPLPELSMGMSGDFEIAIEEGATMIRVGTALFGKR